MDDSDVPPLQPKIKPRSKKRRQAPDIIVPSRRTQLGILSLTKVTCEGCGSAKFDPTKTLELTVGSYVFLATVFDITEMIFN